MKESSAHDFKTKKVSNIPSGKRVMPEMCERVSCVAIFARRKDHVSKKNVSVLATSSVEIEEKDGVGKKSRRL